METKEKAVTTCTVDVKAVRIPNDLRNWNIPDDLRPWIGSISSVYCFDSRRVVRCCEITPSYEMWFIHHVWEGNGDVPEAIAERISGMVMEGDSCMEDVSYIHCGTIDALPAAQVVSRGPETLDSETHDGETEDDLYAVAIEAHREHWRGNWPF